MDGFPLVEEDLVRGCLRMLDPCKSVGLDVIPSKWNRRRLSGIVSVD